MTEERYSFSKDPWGQAVMTGGLALIPARKYPAWLRQTIIWAPALTVTAVAAAPGVPTAVLRRLSQWQGQDPEEVEFPEISPVTRAALAVSLGAAAYAGGRLSFWSDTAAENLVRKLRVPAPRVAMALAAGASAWWSVRRENQQAAARARSGSTS